MDVFRVYTRLVLVTLVVSGAFQLSESFSWKERPPNPTVVVEGVNSSRVPLIWDFIPTSSYIVSISRQKLDGTQQVQIASRTGTLSSTSPFDLTDQSFSTKYEANLYATLVLKNVKQNEEFVYRLTVLTDRGVQKLRDDVTIDVVVPPKITVVPKRDPRLNTGQNFTLSCNASGDPTPNITWTKDGLPVNQFNASGPVLHFVKVQRTDAGSYRCTASNGYGNDVTRVSIVGIRCSDCQTKRVGIKIRSEDWDPDYSREASSDYNTLESKLLSAIFSVYSKNPGKQLYGVDVVNFREGSVDAIVELLFGKSITDPLKPLQDEINDGKLGSFTVDKSLDLNPTTPPPVTSTLSTTAETQGTPSTGARTSGLTTSEMWGIIGGCIAFVLLIVIIILICCICKKKKSGGASKENAPDSDRKDLLSELQLMKKLKPHPHVIKLMGCVTETDPLLVLIEYIPYGDLLGYLRKSRGLNDTYFKDPDVKPQTNLTSQQLMRFCQQIADGMSYLCSSKIIHRDLAARNVLVGEGEKCKVTDFGMARNVYQDDTYTKESRVIYRFQLYQIMLQCWQENPNDRPTFSKLKDTITRMAQSNNDMYVNMKEYDTHLYSNVDDLFE
ncbi:hypothetical protein ACROYT_G028390 [Oculina patagonica]